MLLRIFRKSNPAMVLMLSALLVFSGLTPALLAQQTLRQWNAARKETKAPKLAPDLEEMLAQDGLNTALGGALPVLRAAGMEPVLTISARAGFGTTGFFELDAEGGRVDHFRFPEAKWRGVISGLPLLAR